MSATVDLDKLADALADYSFAYLITVGDDFRAHTVAVEPVLDDGAFGVAETGKRTRRNAIERPAITLLWPPRDAGGYSLIVDGRAELVDDALRVVPTGAVLHRPAHPDAPTASGCGDDCVPLET